MDLPPEECRGASVFQTGLVTALPTLCMVLGSAAISLNEPSAQVQACFQNLSAGLLIGAVVTDIFPMLKEQLSVDTEAPELQYAAAVLGFVAALLLMYGLEALNEEGGGDDKASSAVLRTRSGSLDSVLSLLHESDLQQPFLVGAEEEQTQFRSAVRRLVDGAESLSKLVSQDNVDREELDRQVHGMEAMLHSARRMCRGAEPIDKHNSLRLRFHAGELVANVAVLQEIEPIEFAKFDRQLAVLTGTLRHIHKHAERATFRRWGPPLRIRKEHEEQQKDVIKEDTELSDATIPSSFLVAVMVDSVVDGMLIGLASAVCLSSGMLMAMATAIEMGFLGYSFAITLVNAVQRGPKLGLLIVPPLMMFLSSILASTAADAVKDQPAFVALAAFSMVAVLFLVVHELLVEAHEKEGHDGWRVSVWLYLGLFMSIAMDSTL